MIPLLLLLILHVGISTVALSNFSYLELWRLPFRDSGTLQLFLDLGIANLLACAWMFQDSRTSGVPAIPYIVLAVATGSFATLCYLLHREWIHRSRPIHPSNRAKA